MAKHADFIRAVPGGTAVASNAVTLKKHVDDSTVDSGSSDSAGLYTYTADGSPGPVYEQSTVGSTTKKRSGKSTGQVGTWWLADHPKQMRSFGTGVVPAYTDVNTTDGTMAVTAGSGLQVLVAEGLIFIDGDVYNCTASTGLTVTANSSGSTRIDRIIVRYTREGQTEEGKCVLMMLDGTAGSGIPPALTNSSSVQEFSLAKLTVVNGAASFSSGDITDERYDTTLNQAYAFKWPTGLRNGDLFTITSGKLTRLAVGTSGQVVRSTGSAAAWAAIAAGDLPTAIDAAKIANGTVSNTEFQYVNGVTSAIQTQLDAKVGSSSPTITGTLTTDGLLVNSTSVFTDSVSITGALTTTTANAHTGLIVGSAFVAEPSAAATPSGTYPGAGSGASISLDSGSSDMAGSITLTAGSGSTSGDILKITFTNARSNTYALVFSPRSNSAATAVVKGITSSSFFKLNLVSGALTNGNQYIWDYIVMETKST